MTDHAIKPQTFWMLFASVIAIAATSCTETHDSVLTRIENTEYDPLCIFSVLENNAITRDSDCRLGHDVTEDIRREDGSYGVEFRDANFDALQYVVYRPIGRLKDGSLATSVEWSTGGTGHFSTIYQWSETHGKLTGETSVALGDRCMGGLSGEVKVQDGELHYSTRLTHYGLITLLDGDQPSVPYDAVTDNASDCLAHAEFKGDELQGVRLIDNDMENLRQYRVTENENSDQHCYDDLIFLNYDNASRYFSKDNIGIFIREIKHTCLGAPEAVQ